jgi:hypothetical protein
LVWSAKKQALGSLPAHGSPRNNEVVGIEQSGQQKYLVIIARVRRKEQPENGSSIHQGTQRREQGLGVYSLPASGFIRIHWTIAWIFLGNQEMQFS